MLKGTYDTFTRVTNSLLLVLVIYAAPSTVTRVTMATRSDRGSQFPGDAFCQICQLQTQTSKQIVRKTLLPLQGSPKREILL